MSETALSGVGGFGNFGKDAGAQIRKSAVGPDHQIVVATTSVLKLHPHRGRSILECAHARAEKHRHARVAGLVGEDLVQDRAQDAAVVRKGWIRHGWTDLGHGPTRGLEEAYPLIRGAGGAHGLFDTERAKGAKGGPGDRDAGPQGPPPGVGVDELGGVARPRETNPERHPRDSTADDQDPHEGSPLVVSRKVYGGRVESGELARRSRGPR